MQIAKESLALVAPSVGRAGGMGEVYVARVTRLERELLTEPGSWPHTLPFAALQRGGPVGFRCAAANLVQ